MPRPLTTAADLTGDLAPDTALRRIVAACRADLVRYRAVVLSGTRPIGVHQTRVALRRLRAAVSLFKHTGDAELRAISAEAKRIAGELAPARDLHVFLKETVPEAEAPIPRIGRRLASDRRARARAALSGARYESFEARLAAFAACTSPAATPPAGDQTLRPFGADALALRHDKVAKAGHRIDHLDAAALHKLRIAVKKLRYAAIFLRPVFALPGFDKKAASAYIEAAARLQGALGALNDRAVAAQIIADIAQAARPSEKAQKPLERLAKKLKAGTKRDRTRVARAWKAFRKTGPFWRL